MSQNQELDRIKAKIKAMTLRTMENGCSEAEAMTAMGMVGKLLEQYNLSMDEIDVREQKCITVTVNTGSKRGTVATGTSMAIANFTDCRCWISRGRWGNRSLSFFGTETDAEMAKYLFEIIDAASKQEIQSYKATTDYNDTEVGKRSASTSFNHGMVDRINMRLYQMKKENEASLRAAHNLKAAATNLTPREKQAAEAVAPGSTVTGNALVVLKKQIVESEFKGLGMKLKTSYSTRTIRSGSAYNSGDKAGGRVNLNRPLGGNKTSGYLK